VDERTIFLEALDRTDPVERRAYLDEACRNNPELLAKVEGLLRSHEQAGNFLETPAVPLDQLLALAADPLQQPPQESESAGPTAARVRVVDGPARAFDAETAVLLRKRLTAAAFVTAILMALGLIPTLNLPLLPLRWVLLIVVLGCWILLRSARVMSLRRLRVIELAVFGVSAVQMTAMPAALMLESARAGDVPTLIMDAYFIHGVWALFILTYGLIIPNSWPRALAIMLPTGCIPYVTPYLLGLYEPKVKAAFDSLTHGTPFPIALVAVGVGMIYAHFLQGVRRDLYRARKFGQYQLLARLGGGGMGEVFRAEHELLKRECAIKLIRPGVDANPAAVARFEQEVRETARLSHWNTVEIYDYGRTDEGTFYYVMELLVGLNLADLVRYYGPLPPERTVYLLAQVCDALGEAHGQGLIHRDIKPANIFAARKGGVYDVVKLLDFGLVRRAAGEPMEGATEKGSISGSPAFMAPEQGSLGGIPDTRSDLYSLGAVGYFLLTGRPPFDGATALDQIVAHSREAVVPPSERGVKVPGDLEQVILRCLTKKLDARYPDAATLKRALLACECAGAWGVEKAAAWWATRPEAMLLSAGADNASVTG
jgi:serine/threonine-protein kinase